MLFEGSVLTILGKILHGGPTAPALENPPDLDPKLEAICLKAMTKKAEARYAAMAELAAALEECLPRPPQSETMVKPNPCLGEGDARRSFRNPDPEAHLADGRSRLPRGRAGGSSVP